MKLVLFRDALFVVLNILKLLSLTYILETEHHKRFFDLSCRNFLDFRILSKFTYGPSKGPRVCLNLVDTIQIARKSARNQFFLYKCNTLRKQIPLEKNTKTWIFKVLWVCDKSTQRYMTSKHFLFSTPTPLTTKIRIYFFQC